MRTKFGPTATVVVGSNVTLLLLGPRERACELSILGNSSGRGSCDTSVDGQPNLLMSKPSLPYGPRSSTHRVIDARTLRTLVGVRVVMESSTRPLLNFPPLR